MFEFCVTRLRLSESQAYHRIQAARAAARFPVILAHLREGSVTLTSVALLRPVLTEENHDQLLREAAGRTKRDVECLVRSLAPLPDVAASIRKLATPLVATAPRPEAAHPPTAIPMPLVDVGEEGLAEDWKLVSAAGVVARAGVRVVEDTTTEPSPSRPAVTCAPAARPAEVRPLAPARYSFRVTISEATHARLRRCQDLLGRRS